MAGFTTKKKNLGLLENPSGIQLHALAGFSYVGYDLLYRTYKPIDFSWFIPGVILENN